jgi:hypothetical protein
MLWLLALLPIMLQYFCCLHVEFATVVAAGAVSVLLLLRLLLLLLAQSLSLGEVSAPAGLSKRHLPSHVEWRGTGADGQVKDQVTPQLQ